MSIIVPFDEGLVTGDGGYIYPNGDIKHCRYTNIHEVIASNICCGTIDKARFIKDLYPDEVFYDEYDGDLTKNEFELFKLWMKKHDEKHISLYGACSDFLLYVCGFDKAETVKRKVIQTSNIDPHIRLYNYYLYDCNILPLTKKIYNSETNEFEFINIPYAPSNDDIEAEKELNEIKEKVPVLERKLFLK